MFDTIIVVTDRQVLDEQLGKLIRSLQKDDGIVHTTREGGSKELRELLEKGKDIVITTIQKFPFISETISSLGHRKFGVIIDEVHSPSPENSPKNWRSHFRSQMTMWVWLRGDVETRNPKSWETRPHFFGFQVLQKKRPCELFGSKTSEGQFVPFHIYSMKQSIHEDPLTFFRTIRPTNVTQGQTDQRWWYRGPNRKGETWTSPVCRFSWDDHPK